MAGLKIRVPNNIMQIKAIELMGATPTPMPLGDVYPALTQGVIDGVENPLPVLYGPDNRIAGNLIWCSGLIETKTKKKQGGKGAPSGAVAGSQSRQRPS